LGCGKGEKGKGKKIKVGRGKERGSRADKHAWRKGKKVGGEGRRGPITGSLRGLPNR